MISFFVTTTWELSFCHIWPMHGTRVICIHTSIYPSFSFVIDNCGLLNLRGYPDGKI